MKSFLLLFVCLLAVESFSQSFGVKAGLALTTYSAVSNRESNPNVSRSNISTSFKPSVIAGGFVDFGLSEKVLFRSGLELVVKGGDESGTYTDITGSFPYNSRFNFTAFDVPVDVLYTVGRQTVPHLFFGGGLTPSLLIETGLNKFDLGANAQAGYAFSFGLEASVAYTHGLLNVATHSFDYKSLKNQHLSFTLGYRFKRPASTSKSEAEPTPPTATKPTRVLYAEVGGPGGFLSFNYDTRLTKSYTGLGIRAGVGILFDPYSVGFTVPVALNYLTGEGAHHLELSGGASFFHFKEKNQDGWFNFSEENFVAPFVWVGYRYQPVQNKFVFRAGFTQFTKSGMPLVLRLPVPSLSFGYSLQ